MEIPNEGGTRFYCKKMYGRYKTVKDKVNRETERPYETKIDKEKERMVCILSKRKCRECGCERY